MRSSRRSLRLAGIGLGCALAGGAISFADVNPHSPLATLSLALLAIGISIVWFAILRNSWWSAKATVAQLHKRN